MVFTQIKSFTLSGGGASIRAGAASDRPASYGEVISASGASGDPTQDFPANSFFNIYVDVILPGLGAGGGSLTLINNTPLLVENPGITSFPPKVVYIHGNPTAVPLVFQSDDPALGAHAGDTFGILTLAGHGVGFDQNNAADGKQFENEVAAETEMAVDQQYGGWAPGLTVASPEPAALSLMLLGAIGLLRRNRPA